MATSNGKTVILGAGPYGLATAAHLKAAGLEPHVFGETMDFWEQNMPRGMFLRSSWEASHISDPDGKYTLDVYEAEQGITIPRPIPLDTFVAYGKWFQSKVVPDLDHRRIKRIEPQSSGFRIALDDGESLTARRVVVAAGIRRFAARPKIFDKLPASLVSHAVDHQDLGRFKGKKVAVIGAGQSAVESLAILRESGADAEIIARRPNVRWLVRSGWLHGRTSMVARALYHRTDVGPPGLSQLVARPDLFRRLPRNMQTRLAYRSIRPAAAGWLHPRIDSKWLNGGRVVETATPQGAQLELQLDDGSKRVVDHVLLATGYAVDVSKYEFFDDSVLSRLKLMGGYPVLSSGFESSVPGLHFVGAPAAWSFGPLTRFVSGGEHAAGAVARAIARANA